MHHVIKTERLVLRPLNINDLESVHEYASDKENTRFMMMLPNDTIEESLQYLTEASVQWEKDSPEAYEFAITLDDKQIGAITVYIHDEGASAELGWIINKRYWKKGYAVEASAAIRDFAFEKLKISRLFAMCDARNKNSYRLMEKIGLKLEEGDETRTYPKTGEIAKSLTYSLLME